MSTEYKPVALFGGAITVDLPSTFEDVSEIRQVPDHQEVYLDKSGFSSITIDILERVDASTASSDAAALKYHLSDIVGEEDPSKVKVWKTSDMIFSKLPKGTPCLTLLATLPPTDKQVSRAHAPEFTAVLLTLIRLEKVKTDIVVGVNLPHVPGESGYERGNIEMEKGRFGRLVEEGEKVRGRIGESLEVKDWGLFGESG